MKEKHLYCPLREMSTYGGGFLTRIMRDIWSSRGDVAARFPLNTRLERTAFLIWFLVNADKEFRLLGTCVPSIAWHELSLTFLDARKDCALTVFELAFWKAMPVPEDRLDPGDPDDRLMIKCLVAIWPKPVSQMPTVELNPDEIAKASQKQPTLDDDLPVSVNRIMYAIWKVRMDLQSAFPLESTSSRAAYILWFSKHAREEFDLAVLGEAALTREQIEEPVEGLRHINKFMNLVWISSPDLNQAYDLRIAEQAVAYADWFKSTGRSEHRFVDAAGTRCSAEGSAGSVLSATVEAATETVTGLDPVRELPGGINVIGAVQGGFGIARHAQMTALAANTAGLACCVIDRHVDYSTQPMDATPVSKLASPVGLYRANLYCENAYGLPKALGVLGREFFESYYNIYYGAWEFHMLPAAWSEIVNYFDEAWAPSLFTLECLKRSLRIPVSYVPLAVTVEEDRNLNRRDFGLPTDKFLFLYCFDFYSYIERKNPMACVDAFLKAFPRSGPNAGAAGLVLKVKSVNDAVSDQYHLWCQIRDIAAADDRICIIESDLAHRELVELMALCDAYISLHRAEGFGYTMAEAMLLGKPVVATNYSGNTEFTRSDNSCPVGFDLIPVEEKIAKLIGVPSFWAEPDVEHAAWHMRRLEADRALANRLGEMGKAYISEHYSPLAVGRKIKQRLKEAGEFMQPSSVSSTGQ